MTADDQFDRLRLVKDLAEGASMQARVANRMWLATMTVAVLVLLPAEPAGPTPTVSLPFGLPSVPPETFYPLAFTLLAILIVSLSAAHAQQIRVARFGHRVIDELSVTNSSTIAGIELRDLYDILRLPSLTRVAPLAQLTQGAHQFWSDDREADGVGRIGSTLLYILLKLLAFAVLFVLPALALWFGFRNVAATMQGWIEVLLAVVGTLATYSLLVVAICDSSYVWDVIRLLAGREPFVEKPPTDAETRPPPGDQSEATSDNRSTGGSGP